MQVETKQELSVSGSCSTYWLSRPVSLSLICVAAVLGLADQTAFAQESDAKDQKPKKNRNPGAAKGKKGRDAKSEKGPTADSPAGPRRPGFMPPNGPGPAMMMKFLPIMIALDTDANGELSASEIENAAAALRSLDKDGNGSITMDELRPDPAKMMANMPPEMRERMQERMKREGQEFGKGKKRGGNSENDGSGVVPKRPE